MVILLEDCNAQVARNRYRWYPSLGKFGVGKENSTGSFLQCWRKQECKESAESIKL